MADKNFRKIHYLPSFNIALIYKISEFSFGHHCVHKSQAAKFINIWPSDTYQKNLKQSCIVWTNVMRVIRLAWLWGGGGFEGWFHLSCCRKVKGGMELVTVIMNLLPQI